MTVSKIMYKIKTKEITSYKKANNNKSKDAYSKERRSSNCKRSISTIMINKIMTKITKVNHKKIIKFTKIINKITRSNIKKKILLSLKVNNKILVKITKISMWKINSKVDLVILELPKLIINKFIFKKIPNLIKK